MSMVSCFLVATVLKAGFYLLGGGKILPQTLQLPPQNFCQLNLTKSYSVLAKNLSAIPQLLGPQNCLRMPQNHSKIQKHSGGACPQTPLENCGLWVQPPSTITFPPKPKILDRTLEGVTRAYFIVLYVLINSSSFDGMQSISPSFFLIWFHTEGGT